MILFDSSLIYIFQSTIELSEDTVLSPGIYFVSAESEGHISKFKINGHNIFEEEVEEDNAEISVDTLTWDGSTNGLECYSEGNINICKLTSAIIKESDLANGFIVEAIVEGETIKLTQDDFNYDTEDGVLMLFNSKYSIVIASLSEKITNDVGKTFEKGTYFYNYNGTYPTMLTINGFTGFIVEKVSSNSALTWDGNTEGLECIDAGEGDICRVSYTVITEEDLSHGFTFKAIVNGEEKSFTQDDMNINISDMGYMGVPKEGSGALFVFITETVSTNDANGNSVTLNPGIYFIATSNLSHYSKELKINNINEFILPSYTSGNTLTWDGVPFGYSINDTLFKVSDVVLTESMLTNGYSITLTNGVDYVVITDADLSISYDDDALFIGDGYVVSVPYDNYKIDDDLYVNKGIYFIHDGTLWVSKLTINGFDEFNGSNSNIKNKGDTITWNGNTSNITRVNEYYYKVSDNVITMDDLKYGFTVVYKVCESSGCTFEVIGSDEIDYGEEDDIVYIGGITSVLKDMEVDGVTYKKGLYFMKLEGSDASETIVGFKINNYGGFVSISEDETSYYKYSPNSKTFTLPIPKKEGYTFLGWTGSNGNTPQIEVVIPKGSSGDRSYTANWVLTSSLYFIQAIYSDTDNSLTFINSTTHYKSGDTYIDKDGYEKIVTEVFENFTNKSYTTESSVPWYDYRKEIVKIYVNDEVIPNQLAYWFNDFEKAEYFDLKRLNTRNVTDMSFAFAGAGTEVDSFIIEGLNAWDTSKVTNMSAMFCGTGSPVNFLATEPEYVSNWSIGDLSNWDVSNVTDMSYMFYWAGMFLEPDSSTWSVGNLGSWDVSNVTNMSNMFVFAGFTATSWNIGDLSDWDTSKVTDMSAMFSASGNSATNWSIGDIGNWDTSNVTNMTSMFFSAGYSATSWSIGDLSNWNTSNVKYMSYMFNDAFHSAQTFDLRFIENWDVSNVTSMSHMFNGAGYSAQTFDISSIENWKTDSIYYGDYMFANTGYNATIWNIGNFSNWAHFPYTITGMFSGAGYNATTFDVSFLSKYYFYKGEMRSMFENAGYNSTNCNIGDLSNWYGGTYMKKAFKNACYNSKTVYIKGLSSWRSTPGLKNVEEMFYNFGYNADYSLDLSGWDVSEVTDYNNFNYGVESKITPPSFAS